MTFSHETLSTRRAKGSRGCKEYSSGTIEKEDTYFIAGKKLPQSQVGQEKTDTEDAAASKEPVSFAKKSSKYGGKSHCGLSDFFQVNKNGEPCVRDPG